jgi:AcrR family transcriptional regulator
MRRSSTSTAAPRRRLPPDERRALILAAAGRLFGDRGYDGVSLDQLAAAAGVTKPVLYRHFDSKKGIYMALLERHRRDLPTFIERVPAGLPPHERIEAILDAWFAYVQEHGYAWRMLFRDSGGDQELRAFRAHMYGRAREVMATFVRSQPGLSIPPRQVAPLAELLRSALSGLALWWLDHPDVRRSDLVAVSTRTVAGLLSTPG